MDEEAFREECLEPGRLRPLNTLTERRREAAAARRLSEVRMAAARRLLGSDAEQLAVGNAAFAMEFKANELLARSGWRSKSHVCTQVALSKLLGRKDLAGALSRAYHDRQAFDYTSDPDVMESAASVEEFIEVAGEYIADVEAAIRALSGTEAGPRA